jgi:Flp pilus assembly pilin Flp
MTSIEYALLCAACAITFAVAAAQLTTTMSSKFTVVEGTLDLTSFSGFGDGGSGGDGSSSAGDGSESGGGGDSGGGSGDSGSGGSGSGGGSGGSGGGGGGFDPWWKWW